VVAGRVWQGAARCVRSVRARCAVQAACACVACVYVCETCAACRRHRYGVSAARHGGRRDERVRMVSGRRQVRAAKVAVRSQGSKRQAYGRRRQRAQRNGAGAVTVAVRAQCRREAVQGALRAQRMQVLRGVMRAARHVKNGAVRRISASVL